MKKGNFIQAFLLILLLLSLPTSLYSNSDTNKNNNKSETSYEDIDAEIKFLSPYIGSFPPSFNSEKEKQDILARYEKAKNLIDSALAKHPSDLQLLFRRGKLQSMGHNMDASGAWEGAESDLLQVIKLDPNHKAAHVELAHLYVGTDPSYAPKAEALFKAAAKMPSQEYHENIERGLYFAYYYQGKLCEASAQAKLLVKNWPDHNYDPLLNTVETVIKRSGKKCN